MGMGECDVEGCPRFSADLAYCSEHTPEVDYEIPEDDTEKDGGKSK